MTEPIRVEIKEESLWLVIQILKEAIDPKVKYFPDDELRMARMAVSVMASQIAEAIIQIKEGNKEYFKLKGESK